MKSRHWANNMLYTTCVAIFCNILWGSVFPVLKILYQEMNISGSDMGQNIVLISLRFFMAAIFLFAPVVAARLPLFRLTKKDILSLVLLGLASTTLQYFFFNIGVSNINGIKASILGQVGIFFSILISHFIYKNDKITMPKVIGLLFGFIGLIVVNLEKQAGDLLSFNLFGEGFMIIAGIISALALILAKKIGSHLPTTIMTAWQMLFGSVLLFFIGLGMGGRPSQLQFSPLSILLLIYLAGVSSIAFGLWYYILQFRKVGELSLFKFIVPVSGSMLTAIFLPNEQILPIHVIGLLFVCIGIIIVNTTKWKFLK